MSDSCSPSKLDPGLAATYSTPRSFSTCVIRSDPGRTTARATGGGRTLPASRATWSTVGGGAPPSGGGVLGRLGPVPPPCASEISVWVTSAAALAAALAAAPLRNPRRLTAAFLVFMDDLTSAV